LHELCFINNKSDFGILLVVWQTLIFIELRGIFHPTGIIIFDTGYQRDIAKYAALSNNGIGSKTNLIG
jgi:hypothetical protein